MSGDDSAWFDEDAGPLARPYTFTRGRTHVDRNDLNMITLVVALRSHHGGELDHAHERILACCQNPISIAEVAAGADLPLGVVKVLLSDLIEQNYVLFRTGLASPSAAASPDTLLKVLDGIREL
ncbi:MAG: DUF742 domain-containing protein [Actinophytocola sp.]|nr:DUF742 domain-containing protein [Actinophytocola sp.]